MAVPGLPNANWHLHLQSGTITGFLPHCFDPPFVGKDVREMYQLQQSSLETRLAEFHSLLGLCQFVLPHFSRVTSLHAGPMVEVCSTLLHDSLCVCVCACVRACVRACVCVTSSKWRRWAWWSFDRTASRTSRRAFRCQPRITIFPPHPLGALGWLFDREPSQLLRATVTCQTGCPSTAIIGYGTQQPPLPQGRQA